MTTKKPTAGERIDAALAEIDSAMEAWCEVAKLGACPECEAVDVRYEPWGTVELTLVLGYQGREMRKRGAMRAEATIRLHRDSKEHGDGYCVALIGSHSRERAATPQGALRLLASKLRANSKAIKKARYELPGECL